MASTAELLINITANSAQAIGQLNELTRSVATTTSRAEASTGVFGALGREFTNIGKIAVGMATGMVAADLTIGLAEGFKRAAEQIDSYGQAALKVQRISGGTAEDASTLVAIFQRYTPSLDEATTRLGRFERALAGQEDVGFSAPGGKTAGNFLQEFGVSATDVNGQLLPTLNILEQLAEGFKNSGDTAQKNAALIALFGRGSQSMLLMLNQGRAGIEATAEAARKYGLTLTGENLADVQAFAFAHKDLDMALQGVSLQLGATFMPIITSAAIGVADFAKKINQELVPALKNVNKAASGEDEGAGGALLQFYREGGFLGKIRDALKAVPVSSPIKDLMVGLIDIQIPQVTAKPAAGGQAGDAVDKETAHIKDLTDALDSAKEAQQGLTEAAAQRKAQFDVDSLSDTQKLLDLKGNELEANSTLIDYKRQIEDLDRNAVDFATQRLSLEERRRDLLAQQAAAPLKNASEDIKFQEDEIKAQIAAARSGGPAVDTGALRQRLHELQQEDRRLQPGLLAAEHDVTLAGRATSATDLTTNLAKNATDQLKIGIEQAMQPAQDAATAAKRQLEDQQHIVDLEKQKFELNEKSYVVELAIAAAREKGASAALFAAQHPESLPVYGPAETTPRSTAAATAPDYQLPSSGYGAPGGPNRPLYGSTPYTGASPIQIGINIGQVGTDAGAIWDNAKAQFVAAWQAAMQGTPIAGALGGAFAGGSTPR